MKMLILAAVLTTVSFTALASEEIADLYLNGDSSAVVGQSRTSYGWANMFYITEERIELIQIGSGVACDDKPNRINNKLVSIECIQESSINIIRRVKSQAGRDYIITELKTKGSLDWEGWKATAPDFTDSFKAIGNNEIL
ncbi:hypothetical protein ABH649_000512 [Vibrio cholerae]|nr:hypothetical protein [Vibrio cholerae]